MNKEQAEAGLKCWEVNPNLDVIDPSQNPSTVHVCSSPDQVSSKLTSAQTHLWLTKKNISHWRYI